MNDLQKSYVAADDSLGHLLVQIDTFYQSLPEPIRQAYDNLGSTAKHGCYCDLEEGQEPDGCVIDSGDFANCFYAKPGMVKQKCEYWRPIQFKRSTE